MDEKQKKKLEKKAKKSRLVIRNLSFKIKEQDLRDLFSTYGNIVDISLPKKNNGLIKGFAFLSFDNVKSSLKAIKFINGKNFFNRTLAVDFAVPKNVYTQLQESQTEPNENDSENDKTRIKDVESNVVDDDDEINNDIEDEDEDDNVEEIKKKRKHSDVTEGKTIFIRNLDLETDEFALSNLFNSFGNIEYCKICYDQYSGKSKGSAFVKFKKKEDAQKCLEEVHIPENPKLYLDGKQLIVTTALMKHQLEQMKDLQNRKYKDKRNLYLAKEGLIYPDSPAAKGVSQNDLKKRLMLEEKKRKLLQNLHNFVSDKRLCIHNLPLSYDDDKLKKLFLNASGNKNARILWAKVMRNRNNIDKKFGKSKGFGFVEFNEHTYALKALRYLNNNPDIFTIDRRPIVEFSIENKVALNIKKYRLLKQGKLNTKTEKNIDDASNINLNPNTEEQELLNYSGVNAKPFKKNEKVIGSKINRKILEQRKKLKILNKKLTNRTKIGNKKKFISQNKRNADKKINSMID